MCDYEGVYSFCIFIGYLTCLGHLLILLMWGFSDKMSGLNLSQADLGAYHIMVRFQTFFIPRQKRRNIGFALSICPSDCPTFHPQPKLGNQIMEFHFT